MQNHFTFGHTIQPIQIESGSSSLEDLFKIGDEHIQLPQKEQEQLSDSDETPKQKKKKKVKKEGRQKRKVSRQQRKESRQKRKRSRSRKGRKDRVKGKGGEGAVIDLQSSGSGVVALPEKRRDRGAMELLQRSLRSKYEDLSSNFSVNKKVGEGLLNIDILSFPQKELFEYGPMDKDIPQYSKYPNFHRIIGSPLKKQKAIDQGIRNKINQKNSNPHKDNISRHRYFHYSGYAGLTDQPLPHYRALPEERSFIPLGQTEAFSQSVEEEKRLKTVREFNSKLNSNPKNVDLWLQFAESQESHLGKSRSKGRSAALDRQLSILEKALQCNPLDQKLGLFYLDLLYRKQSQPALIMAKCMQLIKVRPDCVLLWKSYLSLQLCQFSRYSHELTRKAFQELTRILRQIMDSTRSAMEVWRIKKSGLELIRNMVMVYKLSGYGELATGIVVGLVDFNFFMPDSVVKMINHKDKVSAFGEYWENHSAYKLGEVELQAGWENQDQIVPPETTQFIGHLDQQPPADPSDLLTKELTGHRWTWRPSHPIHDRETISQQPQSYVLIEDIEFTLHLYRDTECLTSLLDILADHLQFPQVFRPAGFNSQFGCSLVRGSFAGSREGSSLLGEQTYWWRRYWNPSKSGALLSPPKMQKLQYFKRILQQARSKLPEKYHLPLTRYLVFICCCYYASQELQERLKISEEETLKDLEQLLREASSDMGCWCIYVSTTHRIKGNTLECIECYLQLLESNHKAQEGDRREKEMEIIFYLWTFVGRHRNQALRGILKLYLRLLDQAQMDSYSLEQELTANDEHRLTRYFKEKLSVIHEGKLKNKIETVYLQFIVLDCLALGHIKGVLQQQDAKQYLIGEMLEGNDPSIQHFILNSLIDRRALSPQIIAQKDLLTEIPYLELVQYWVRENTKPLVIFLSDFEALKHKSLSLWMATDQYLSKGVSSHLGIQDHLFGLGRQLCFEDSLHDQHPDYVILLSEMLLREVGQSPSEFLRYALNQLPYAKELYIFNLMSSPQKEEREKIVALMQEKSIRILQSELTGA